MQRSNRTFGLGAFALAMAASTCLAAVTVDDYWLGTMDSSWMDQDNWESGALPTTNEFIEILASRSGFTSHLVNYDNNTDDLALATLKITVTGSAGGGVELNGTGRKDLTLNHLDILSFHDVGWDDLDDIVVLDMDKNVSETRTFSATTTDVFGYVDLQLEADQVTDLGNLTLDGISFWDTVVRHNSAGTLTLKTLAISSGSGTESKFLFADGDMVFDDLPRSIKIYGDNTASEVATFEWDGGDFSTTANEKLSLIDMRGYATFDATGNTAAGTANDLTIDGSL